MKFLPIITELYVTDIEKSLKLYKDLLGFQIRYSRKFPKFVFLENSKGSQIMLQELQPGEKESFSLEFPFGRGINFQIDVKNVEEVSGLLKGVGYKINEDVKEYWYDVEGRKYGCKELHVSDPDGYFLRLSEDIGFKSSQ
jgi:catechol 2,3-dioxygenase-like lactoylglutathione lyase family enzyme